MSLIIVILFACALILLGAQAGKPIGWIALGLAVIALLLAVLGGLPLSAGPVHR